MSTLKLKKPAAGAAPADPRHSSRRPVRGSSAPRPRPTLEQAQQERAQRREQEGHRDEHLRSQGFRSQGSSPRGTERDGPRGEFRGSPFARDERRGPDSRDSGPRRDEHRHPHDRGRPEGTGGAFDQERRSPFGDSRPTDRPRSQGFRSHGGDRPFPDDRPRSQGFRSHHGDRPFDNDRPRSQGFRSHGDGRDDRGPREDPRSRSPFDNDRPPRAWDERHPTRPPEGSTRSGAFGRPQGDRERGRDDRDRGTDRPFRGPASGGKPPIDKPWRERLGIDAPRGGPQAAGRAQSAQERQRPAPPDPVRDEHAPHPDGSVRLSKRMSELGLASRREADEWIERGWVRVDGEVVATLGTRVQPEQQIEIDNRALGQQAQRVTVLMHKPAGYVSGQAEDGNVPAATLFTQANRWPGDHSGIKFVPDHLKGIAPAGRLDLESTGLLVFTQDGRVARQLIGGDGAIEKEYLVEVANEHGRGRDTGLSDEQLALLRHGLMLDDTPLRPADVDWTEDGHLRFVLREGRKRQIRRMCEQVGLQVLDLHRIRVGKVLLGGLQPGQWRYLGRDESFAE